MRLEENIHLFPERPHQVAERCVVRQTSPEQGRDAWNAQGGDRRRDRGGRGWSRGRSARGAREIVHQLIVLTRIHLLNGEDVAQLERHTG